MLYAKVGSVKIFYLSGKSGKCKMAPYIYQGACKLLISKTEMAVFIRTMFLSEKLITI